MLDLFHDLVKNAILEPAASAAPVLWATAPITTLVEEGQ
jgi:hypothetical protein